MRNGRWTSNAGSWTCSRSLRDKLIKRAVTEILLISLRLEVDLKYNFIEDDSQMIIYEFRFDKNANEVN